MMTKVHDYSADDQSQRLTEEENKRRFTEVCEETISKYQNSGISPVLRILISAGLKLLKDIDTDEDLLKWMDMMERMLQDRMDTLNQDVSGISKKLI